MAEKRFEVDSRMYGATDIKYYLKDNTNELVDGYGDEIYWGDGSSNGLKQIVNKLNELYEENKELIQKNKKVKRAYDVCKFRRMNDANVIHCLEEENKKLKQKIESLKMEIAELRESEKDNYNITDGLW